MNNENNIIRLKKRFVSQILFQRQGCLVKLGENRDTYRCLAYKTQLLRNTCCANNSGITLQKLLQLVRKYSAWLVGLALKSRGSKPWRGTQACYDSLE